MFFINRKCFSLSLGNYKSQNQMDNKCFSQRLSVFHGIKMPEEGYLVGYAVLIDYFSLEVPTPDYLTLISLKNRKYKTEDFQVLTPRYQPKETLYHQLVFALKYEGIHVLFFKKLFEKLPQEDIIALVQEEPQGQYSRRIWFLYEWLMKTTLPIPDLDTGNFIMLIDDKLQYTIPESENSKRHRVKNNCPGTSEFCPLIRRTKKLDTYLALNPQDTIEGNVKGIHKDILLRTSSFLLLKDSKASFNIEGETPTQSRAIRWGKAIGQAGRETLSKVELERLQHIVIGNSKFTKMGYRLEGGFVGEHDRINGTPIPEHISAKHQDIEKLMEGLLNTSNKMITSNYHPVLTATSIAFGFVFIHPFEDGNGRLHRYLIHHLLAVMKFTPQGIIFPISASILERINDYRKVLEHYSHPLLNFIEWEKTKDNNVKVNNDTIDFYRYFEATKQAEFLSECIDDTINRIIPDEVDYLQKYDAMKAWLDDHYQMPDKKVALLIRFLEQNNGLISNRAKEKEFVELTNEDIQSIEDNYRLCFN